MELMNRVITGAYWVVYYLVYVAGVALLVYHFWDELPFLKAGLGHLDLPQLFILAAILAVAGGTALFIAINVEVTGRMVLLIPKAWNRAKDVGRAEGLAQGLTKGRAEARAEERDRVQAILSEYGRRDPETGRLVLDLDQDAEERLRNGKDNGKG